MEPMAESEIRRLIISYEAASSGSPTTAVARDASLGGLFIETKNPLPIGALLTVELMSVGQPLTLEARVFLTRDASEGPERPAGMAVRFLDLPSGMLPKLQAVFEHVRPPARTTLGIGDENEALWASAGGRDEMPSEDDALAVAAAILVEGRPLAERSAAGEAPAAPGPPAPPSSRRIPLTLPSKPSMESPVVAQCPVLHSPLPRIVLAKPPPRRSPLRIIFVALVIVALALVIVSQLR
jgi:hypothetical protein